MPEPGKPGSHKGLLKTVRRVAVCTVFAFSAAIACYAACALLLGLLPRHADFRQAQQGVDLYIQSNGVHTDIVMPVAFRGWDWRQQLAMNDVQPDRLLAFGWGDRAFYMDTPTWADLRASTAVQALLGLDRAVIHVESVATPPWGDQAARLRVTPAQAIALAQYIRTALDGPPGEPARPLTAARVYQQGMFFAAKGHYSAFTTCNEWVREGLDQAGLRTATWAPFDVALLYQWRRVPVLAGTSAAR